ncbi:MAG: A/G-specific adenine glycosylase [Thermodesulfobacteriota bacterium]
MAVMPDTRLPEAILAWFAAHSRDLPWRQDYAPYHILLSEIMLQQTQMERVIGYFSRWIGRFPDISALAAADEEEVLKQWEGLGYYPRARNLHQAARRIMRDHGGVIPADHAALLRLPGIGPYTAGAVMSLAFNQNYPLVDANVERLFARLDDIDSPVREAGNQRFLWQRVRDLIPDGRARHFNQALMELGALVCTPRNPACPVCPLSGHCKALRAGTVECRPVRKEKQAVIRIEMVTGILLHQGRIFIQKRPPAGVWANLWEFPGGQLEPGESPEEALVREYREETEWEIRALEKLRVVRHSYTRYRVTLHGYCCLLVPGSGPPVLHAAQECRWVLPMELDNFAFPTGHRQLIAAEMAQLVRRAAAPPP